MHYCAKNKNCFVVTLKQWFLTFVSTASPLSNCPLCQAPLKTKNLCKQIYLSVNFDYFDYYEQQEGDRCHQ